ncbi:phosphoglycerate mutase family protein [Rhodococcus spelaei]|uniref:Phosphoglycerate mutase family protein n=1 Tax=Rhodococcus spelaei TaxID=2546320 RepID=A0A541B8Y4_9NOCA|nr:phosphoglycerate mutase family protein [Rhodococcus spelaei]TQF68753.1 phosphoglycerate mutase family protein [Rhodococcus spelaei]
MAEDRDPDTTTIMFIRHAERPEGDGPPFGMDEDGSRCDESLTTIGWQRARALVGLFAPESGNPTAGLVRPVALFASTPSKKNGSKRSVQTVTPLAHALGVTVDTDFGRSDVKALAKTLRRTPGPVLVAWQREYLPEIVGTLGAPDTDVPGTWPEDRYDVVWVLTRSDSNAWTLRQTPQNLLPGDLPTGI